MALAHHFVSRAALRHLEVLLLVVHLVYRRAVQLTRGLLHLFEVLVVSRSSPVLLLLGAVALRRPRSCSCSSYTWLLQLLVLLMLGVSVGILLGISGRGRPGRRPGMLVGRERRRIRTLLSPPHAPQRGESATDSEGAQRHTDTNTGLSPRREARIASVVRRTRRGVTRGGPHLDALVVVGEDLGCLPLAPVAVHLDHLAAADVVQAELVVAVVARDRQRGLGAVGLGPGLGVLPGEQGPAILGVGDLVELAVGADVEDGSHEFAVDVHAQGAWLSVPGWQRVVGCGFGVELEAGGIGGVGRAG